MTLSEMEAIEDLNKRHEMMQQWGQDRGFNHSYPGLVVMRYIERLEDDRRHLLASVMQLLTITRGEQNYHNSIILKAQHLLATIDQLQHEREAVTRDTAE